MFLDQDTIFYILRCKKTNKVIFDSKIVYILFSQSMMQIYMCDQGFLDKYLNILHWKSSSVCSFLHHPWKKRSLSFW